MPGNPRAWLVGVTRHKALDRLRRESRRVEKETVAVRAAGEAPPVVRNEALAAYRTALSLEPPPAERVYLERRVRERP